MSEKPKKLTREDIAKLEIGVTAISRGQKILLCAFFLGMLAIYPVWQTIHELKNTPDNEKCVLQSFTIFERFARTRPDTSKPLPTMLNDFNKQLIAAIGDYEDALDDASALRALLLAPVQAAMTKYLGFGNDSVVVGDDGYLFFTDDFSYVVNPGFMRSDKMHKRALSGVQPNPIEAIVDFRDQLAARGIELILLPVPVKPMMYADKLGGDITPVNNPDYAEFLRQLAELDINVVDITSELAALRGSGVETYLKTDTHWTPEAMHLAATLVAEAIGGAPSGIEPNREVTALGDIAIMLRLDEPEALFPLETVSVHEVDSTPNSDARVLLLGDSFVNIYSLGAMNWGIRAGFAENLAYLLDEPIDVLARNDAASYATRQLLANELRRGRDRLAGKDVVVWQFVMRELLHGDWRVIDMTLGDAPEEQFFVPTEPVNITATVLAATPAPRPGSAPYKDHIIALHLGDIDGGDEQALVFAVSMRDNVWQPAASLRPGEKVTIKLSPWSEAELEYGSWNRTEFDSPDLMLQEPVWGEIEK